MNVMTDIWTVFGADAGQGVEVAYRYDADGDRIVRRRIDHSDGTVDYASAPCPDEVEWAGAESVAPRGELDWAPCENPFSE